jgi:hypothetical protein
MRRIRFTIASLLVVVLFVAIGFTALRESSDLWDSGLFSVTLGVLLISILLAIHRAESRRTFWIGFALFGWGYLVLSLFPATESRLITTQALTYLDSLVPGRSPGFIKIRFTGTGSGVSGNPVQKVAFTPDGRLLATSRPGVVGLWDAATGKLVGVWRGTTENFTRIGHLLFALLAGWVGGLLSRRLWRVSRATDASTLVDDEGTNP